MIRAGLLILACLLAVSYQKSTREDDSYVAAVLEYEVNSNITLNLENYLKFIEEAAKQNADILVFPEMTLTRGTRRASVPIHGLLKEYPVPALKPDLYDEILVAVSKAAREHQIYVMINLQESMDCNDAPGEYCPERKEYKFNTNVVFDRNGAVIDRYRKINLFGEYVRSPALKPDLGVFNTDFGVTFGHFICFDITFQVPAVQVVEKYNLKNVVYSTMWFSDLPYITAVQMQQAYAESMNINFIAAGANNVRVGSAGSGIYSGRAGALVSVMPDSPMTRLLVSRVPKIPGEVKEPFPGPLSGDQQFAGKLRMTTDATMRSQVSRLLVEGSQEFTLTNIGVSCKFTAKLRYKKGQQGPYYRAFAIDDVTTIVKREMAMAVCSVVACKGEDLESCPFRFNKMEAGTEIEQLKIEMTSYPPNFNSVMQCDDVVYLPLSLKNDLNPLSSKNYNFVVGSKVEEASKGHVSYHLKDSQTDLVSFGIMGRIFSKDVNHNKEATPEDIQQYLAMEDWIYNTNQGETQRLDL